jgi:hypothetical protein
MGRKVQGGLSQKLFRAGSRFLAPTQVDHCANGELLGSEYGLSPAARRNSGLEFALNTSTGRFRQG